MSAEVGRPRLMYVPLDLIDEPDEAMRQTFDPHKMDELIESIRAHGVIQPVALVQAGDRYRVAAGHRRSIAAVAAGLDEIPAAVYPEGTPTEEAVKNHENAFREEVNPAEEALYFQRVLKRSAGDDTVKLAGMVGRRLEYVEGRLNLLRGYPEVFEALREGKINVSVAREFNQYKDHGFMLSHLETVKTSGATARQVARWRTDLENMTAQFPQSDTPSTSMPAGQPIEPPKMCCAVCGGSKDPYNLEFMYVHRGGPCADILDTALNRIGGGG